MSSSLSWSRRSASAGGAEAAMITVYDLLRLDPESGKERMLTTCKWILRGALADSGTSSA